MKILLLVLGLCGLVTVRAGDEGATVAKPAPQFVGVLHLAPRLYPETAWTKVDEEALGRHFVRLQTLAKEGKVILAGRTSEPNETTFGLVLFEAETQQQAEAFMAADPAVVAGVMTFEVHPFFTAVARAK